MESEPESAAPDSSLVVALAEVSVFADVVGAAASFFDEHAAADNANTRTAAMINNFFFLIILHMMFFNYRELDVEEK
ncbi:MAG: hypothetical protein ACLTAC_17980 [Hungatella sp.]